MSLREFDDVLVTGKITSESDHPVTRLRAVVATVSGDGYVKVWPVDDDPQLPKGHNGKLWFNTADPETKIEVVPETEGAAT